MLDLEKKIKNSKNTIVESSKYNPKQLYEYAKMKEEKEVLKFSINKCILVIPSIILICVLTLTIFLLHGDNIKHIDKTTNMNKEFKQFETVEELKEYINNSTKGFSLIDGELNGEKDDLADIEGVSTDSNYNTNIQVENVEEADIVKVKGDYIYYISQSNKYYNDKNNLYVLKKIGDNLEVIKKVIFGKAVNEIADTGKEVVSNIVNSHAIELYVTDNYLIVHCEVKEYISITLYESNNPINCEYRHYATYNIYDINTYEEVKCIKTPGQNVSTRLINNNLYIVNNYYDYRNCNEDIILPGYYVDDILVNTKLDRVFYCPYFGTIINSYVIVFKIELDENIKVTDLYFLSPSIRNIYVTEKTIYLINFEYSDLNEKQDQYISTYDITKITMINIEDEPYLEDIICVKGIIRDKYWIDEYNGYLRIATTGSQYNYKVVLDKYKYFTSRAVFNYVTIFKKDGSQKWQEINCITEGIGKEGESIRSVRFNKEIATVVTFRQTDPLYYIDLTNPNSPKITSQLEISGFTVYQHPYLDSYVIGFGYEASLTGGITGYKIALFDISDKFNIKEVGTPLQFSYNKGYYNLDVINEPKYLMLDLKNGLFGFSIKQNNNSCYYVCKINDSCEAIEICFVKASSSNNPLDRMVYIGDTYYLLSWDTVFIYKNINNEFTEIDKLGIN